MSNLLKSKILLGVMIVAVMFVGAFALSTSSALAEENCTVSVPLQLGSSGAQVMCLQSKIGAVADGAFGPMTQAKVMAFQASNGLMADGIVGPATRAALMNIQIGNPNPTPIENLCPNGMTLASNCTMYPGTPNPVTLCPNGMTLASNCTVAPDGTPNPNPVGPLQGGAGNLESAEFISSINNEEVGESAKDVEIVGIEVEADNNSDLQVLSLRVLFDNTHTHDAVSSDDLDDYADEVSVWFEGKKVGSADVEDFSEGTGHVWSKTISIDSGAVVKADETADLIVALSAVNNLDSTDKEETWTVEVDSLRYGDAQGAILTESTLDGIGDTRNFSFESFSSAQDVEMKVSLSDDEEVNDAHVIDVDTSDETKGVEVLSFDVEAEGDSDLLIDEMVVDLTTSEDDLNDVVSVAYLFMDGEEVDSVNITSEEATDVAVTFDNLDLTIDAGDTVTFTVEVDFEAIDASFIVGTTLLAEITDDETDAWDVEDESGEELADTEKTGTAASGAHGAYAVGLMAKFVSSTAVATPSGVATVDDTGTFKIVFDVTAFDSDIFIDASPIVDETGIIGVGAAGYQNIDASTTSVAAGVIECSGCNATANTTLEVKQDTTERFTVTIAGSGADVFASASLTSIMYATTAIDGALLYTFDMTDFKTDSVWLDSN